MNTQNTPSKEKLLNIAIGQQIGEILNLKFDKTGKTKTTWGTKTVEGLGAIFNRIAEEEKERLKDY